MKYVVIDICGTLYRSNTTFDFLYWRYGNNIKYKLLNVLYHWIIWRLINKVIWRVFHCDLTRMLAVRFLKGSSKEELYRDVEEFYDSFLLRRKNEKVFDILAKFRDECDNHLILVSATLDFIAECVARRTMIPLFASTELKYKGNICMGQIKNDMLGNKIKVLSGIIPIYCCVSDDYLDIALLKSCEKPIVVCYPSGKKKWQRLSRLHNIVFEVVNINN